LTFLSEDEDISNVHEGDISSKSEGLVDSVVDLTEKTTCTVGINFPGQLEWKWFDVSE